MLGTGDTEPRGADMHWSQQIFSYCERGLDPRFWAEPLNAVSNVAFIIAAAAAMLEWRRTSGGASARDLGLLAAVMLVSLASVMLLGVGTIWASGLLAVLLAAVAIGLAAFERGGRGPSAGELALAILVLVIGIGSFLFHTYATRWAAVADVAPITMFMIAYLTYAMRRFLGLSWPVTLVGVAVFIGALASAETIRCDGRPCLNGSVGYLPALAVMALIGGWLAARGHGAARWLLWAAAVFVVSLTFRTLDRSLCPATAVFSGRVLGTHFIWHMLNATLLYLLLVAALRHGERR